MLAPGLLVDGVVHVLEYSLQCIALEGVEVHDLLESLPLSSL